MPRLEQVSLFDTRGSRKYLCARELPRFLDVARRSDIATLALCSLLAYTGCRLSEALAVTPAQLDTAMSCVVFRTLKRRCLTFRAVPVPTELMQCFAGLARSARRTRRYGAGADRRHGGASSVSWSLPGLSARRRRPR